MGRILVFNSITLDGYFADLHGDIRWAYNPVEDNEWIGFVNGNASGEGILLFGRITFEMMKSYWPTPAAKRDMPVVADRMNSAQKIVFSGTLKSPGWDNTRIISTNITDEVRTLKTGPHGDMVILGSGSIVAQLTEERLVDEYQFVVTPNVLGSGKSMFAGVTKAVALRHVGTRTFKNGNVVLTYQLAK